MHELRWMGVAGQGCCGNTNTETEWRSSGGLDRKSAKMEGWCVEAKTHLGEAQLKHYDLHRNNAWAPDKHPRQKVRATTLKCFNKQYCVMKSQYKQISILKLKEMSDKIYSADWGLYVASSNLRSDSKIIKWEEVKLFVISVTSGDAWLNLIRRRRRTLLSMIFNIDDLCCKSFRESSDRLLIKSSMVNHWQ